MEKILNFRLIYPLNMIVNRWTWQWLFLAFFFFQTPAIAQKSKEELEKDRRENLRRIEETQKILRETANEKEASLGQLNALNRQIQQRQNLINSLRSEIDVLGGEIDDLSSVVNALQNDLAELKEEYAAMIYAAYRSNWGLQKLTFLFSAKTFNQLLRRLEYLDQYTDARQIQVAQIIEVTRELENQRAEVQSKQQEQNKLLAEQLEQNRNLVRLKERQSSLVATLSAREKELKREVDRRKKSIAELDQLIASIIKKENEAKASSVTSTKEKEDVARLSSSFESNKNKLAWPVETGFISSKFGKQPHPILKGIMVENQGVDIQTNKDAKVKAVFPGQVATVAFVPGMNSVVILRHGDYYTLYARLKKVNVKKGQTVESGDLIGEVFTDKEGLSEVQFQVWKSNIKLNPEHWLSVR